MCVQKLTDVNENYSIAPLPAVLMKLIDKRGGSKSNTAGDHATARSTSTADTAVWDRGHQAASTDYRYKYSTYPHYRSVMSCGGS